MKKSIILLFILLLIFDGLAQFEWDWLNPYPTGNDIISLAFLNEQTGYILSRTNDIFKTLDGGSTWNKIRLDSLSQIYDIYFITADVGYLCGKDGVIMKTINGGESWEKLSPPIKTNFYSLYFEDENVGWVAGYQYVLKTSDGGNTWDYVFIEGLTSYVDLFMLNDQIGYVLSGKAYTFYKTEDGGNSWQKINLHPDGGPLKFVMRSVFFLDVNRGFIVGHAVPHSWGTESGFIVTDDGGKTWKNVTDITSGGEIVKLDKNLYDIQFVNGTGYAVGENGTVLKSTDWGKSWELLNKPTGYGLLKFTLFSEDTLLVVGRQGKIIKSENGGTSWLTINEQITFNNLSSVDFYKESHGWIVGEKGTILRTEDDGQTWLKVSSGTNNHLRDVYFVDSLRGFVVGDNGTILKSEDGGVNWRSFNNIFSVNFNSVFFLDSLKGFIVGEFGYLLKTVDGGLNWQYNGLGTKKLNSIFFRGNKGWIVGDDGTVFRSLDGGINWFPDPPISSTDLEKVFFIDNNTGWIAGNAPFTGYLYRSTDGGFSWQEFEIEDLNKAVKGLFFPASYFGLVVGQTEKENIYEDTPLTYSVRVGAVYITTNGGRSTNLLYRSDLPSLNDITFVTDSTFWIVGDLGAMLYGKVKDISTRIGEAKNQNTTIQNFVLRQNYPNPFNPVTMIPFDLPHPQEVVLTVFDISGKTVKTLAKGFYAAGSHQIKFDGSSLSSGVYFYRLSVGKQQKTRKMLLLR